MKRLILLIGLICIFNISGITQSWDTTITAGSVSNDAGNKVKFDSNGNMIVNGSCSGTTNFGSSMLNYTGGFVAKYDAQGNLIWVIKAGGNLSFTAVNKQASGSIELDSDDNIYITGNFTDTAHIGNLNLPGNATNKNVFLAKISPSGNALWTKYVTNNSVSTGIALDADRNVGICGYTEGVTVFDGNTITPFGGNPRDAFFAKYDSVGTFAWVRQCGGPGTFGDRAFAIGFDESKNVLVSGWIRSNSTFGSLTLNSTAPALSYYNGFLTKYSSTGTPIWVTYCGYSPVSLTTNATRDIFVTGYTGPENGFDTLFNPQVDKPFITKLDSNGTYQWASCATGPGTSGSCDIVLDNYDNAYIAGHYIDTVHFGNTTLIGNAGPVWYPHLFVAKYNGVGMVQWVKKAGGDANSMTWGFGIDIMDTCTLAVCGSFQTPAPVVFEDTVNSVGLYDFFISTFSTGCNSCNNTINSLTENACGEYQSPSGQWYYSSQTIIDTIPNFSGCDSIITINLTIQAMDTSVTIVLPTLTSNNGSGSYQWIDCDNSFALINGETNQSYTPGQSGHFAVIITDNGCIDTSACHFVPPMGIEQNILENELQIYPNPSNGVFKINTTHINEGRIQISNTIGQVIFVSGQISNEIDLSTKPKGTYYIQFYTDDKIYHQRIILQ